MARNILNYSHFSLQVNMSQEMPQQNHHRLLDTVCQAGRKRHLKYSHRYYSMIEYI